MTERDERVAWSSDGGAAPRKPTASGSLPAAKPPTSAAAVRVGLERAGRGGKAVTVILGLTAHPAAIEDLAKTLKARCGAGGSVKGKTIEIQGDQRDRVVAILVELGYAAKKAGG